MEARPGTYALVLQCTAAVNVQIGRWGTLQLQPGFYVYVGSAFGPGGVLSRVSRHCRADKARRWHIDYLREHATPVCCWYCHHPEHFEHQWADAVAKAQEMVAIDGFGCSDCRCRSHLFYAENAPQLTAPLKRGTPAGHPVYCEVFKS